jgi:AAA domain, putative AbiEii toxin, Type IV TA system
MKLYLENVRSFEGWHEIPIAPATVLLGENSAGKSTLLGMLSVVHNEGFPFSGNFFNQFPFEFGGYKTLACNKKGVTHFSIGFETETRALFPFNQSGKPSEKYVSTGLIVAFRENDGLPVPCHMFAWNGDTTIIFCEEQYKHIDRLDKLQLSKTAVVNSIVSPNKTPQGLSLQQLFQLSFELREKKNNPNKSRLDLADDIGFMAHRLFSTDLIRSSGISTMAFAPVRSRPKRHYSPLSDEFSPEGDNVPLLLARAADPNNKNAKALHQAIRDYGNYSEMFSDIGVKQLGRGSGDPFQVQVKVGTKQTNLMDVGYGVSQVLPLIVDAQRATSKTTLLLQQPEVHLHPKAQAALGSMIKDWVSKNKKTVVVETHSDYLVDRLRLEVKRDNLKVSDLKIFFLEKKNGRTELHVLEVDTEGNILNAPDGYRDFFLREQMALLVD